MKIFRARITNFRCIKEAEFFPSHHNVLLGPNNIGKTAILEALNLLLNPEIGSRSQAIDENDFYRRDYQPSAPPPSTDPVVAQASDLVQPQPAKPLVTAESETTESAITHLPIIRIEAVLNDLSDIDEDLFRRNLVPLRLETREIVEGVAEGEDPFANAVTAIRVVFDGWYDLEEDDFHHATYFLRSEGMEREDCEEFTRNHKRHIGFLIYRDFRALTRPITLEPVTLFSRLLQSQGVVLQRFEEVLSRLNGALDPMTSEPSFASILNAYKSELERFISLSAVDPSALSFELTNHTRSEVKHSAELYVRDEISLPIQEMGAGTRSLAILAMLTLIMRRRGSGILALEEPETFLFPHAQRRVIDECLELATQTFVTTHSPFVLERIPVDGVGRVNRQDDGEVSWTPLATTSVKQLNLYSKRLRQSFCEALLGRGVVIVEGDSDRWWINGASRILNRKTWNGRQQEALELQGIAVVSAESNGDVLKVATFFNDADLKVIAVVDKLDDQNVIDDLCNASFPTIFLKQSGLEALLAEYLPVGIIRRILSEATSSKVPTIDVATVTAMSEPDLRSKCKEMLISNKGSASLHEWIMTLVDENTMPRPLGNIIDLVSAYTSGTMKLGTSSLSI